MLVIVVESVPPRLRGWLSRLFLEVRAGVYVGQYSVRVRELVWNEIQDELGDGNAVLLWPANNDIGFDFDTCGSNRRVPIDFDGLKLCAFQSLTQRHEMTGTESTKSGTDDW